MTLNPLSMLTWLLVFPVASSFAAGVMVYNDYARDHVIVKFKPGAALLSTGPVVGREELLQALNLPAGFALREPDVRQVLRNRNETQPAAVVDLDTFYYLDLPPGASAEECVRRVEPHPWVDYVEMDGVGQGGAMPNDSFFPNQWHHHNPVTPSASIHTPLAWEITQGATNIVVAVLDTGLNSSSEFTDRLVPGYNVVAGNANTTDDNGHGTAVAGVLAANANNATLVAGVDWYCRVMPVKVLNASNSGLYSWWAQGVDFAVNNSAKVINLSAGGSDSSTTLTRAITNAIAQGVIFVTITHNDSSGIIRYPGNLAQSITVGATDAQDRRTSFSNYGPQIDLCAPGTNIFTVSSAGTLSQRWGTSFAAPQVAGVASLLTSVRPDLSQDAARLLMCAGADDEVGDPGDTPGFDSFYGWGRLNAYNSLLLAQTAVDQVGWTNGVLHLSWPSPPNASNKQPFQVQYRDTLHEDWETASDATGYTYTSNRTYWSDTHASATGRIYRLRLKPLL